MTRSRAAAVLILIAVAAVLPFAFGYGRQDFVFHVQSWLGTRDAWLSGHLLPEWAAAASFNLGDPHLGLYPPLSILLGAFLTLILPIAIAPAAFVWLAILGCGLSMYRATRAFLPTQDRLAAAILYMLNPYVLANAWVRFAAAELLLQALLPLILLAAYKLISPPVRAPFIATSHRGESVQPSEVLRHIPLLAALLALGWLTNFPGSIVLFYGLSILAVLTALHGRSIRPAVNIAASEALALALAAFRLLPAWAEHTWIQEAVLYKRDPRMGLLFMRHWPLAENITMVVFWLFLCAEALILFACLRRKAQPLSPASHTWAWLAGIAIFFQTPLAYPLWAVLPQLRVVQFPFRFLLFLAPILPLLLLAPSTRKALRRPVYLAIVALNLVPLILFIAMQSAVRGEPMAALAQTWRTQGYESAPEYIPATATAPTHPTRLSPIIPLYQSCSVNLLKSDGSTRVFTSDSPHPCPVALPVFFYPHWHAVDETDKPIATSSGPAGLLMVTVPAGVHTVTVAFHPASRARTAGLAISVGALFLLILLAVSRRRQPT